MASDGQGFPQVPPPGTPSGQPGPTAKTLDEHWAYVIRKLGGGIIDIELTDDHKMDCLEDAQRWFAERVGFIKYVQLPLIPGQSEYFLSSDIAYVYDLWLPSFQLPTLDVDSFSFTYFTQSVRVLDESAAGPNALLRSGATTAIPGANWSNLFNRS